MKRGRNQRRRQGVNPNRAYDSNGPDVRIRGTANQIYDKYQALARDAASAGDRVKAENYLQHAEHYFRLIRSMQPAAQEGADSDSDTPVANGHASEGREDRRPSQRRADPGDGEQPSIDGGASAKRVNGDAAEEDAKDATKTETGENAGEDAKDDGERPSRPRRKRRARTTKADKADAAEDAPEETAAAQ